MRVLVLSAVAALGCVTQDVVGPQQQWELAGEGPLVAAPPQETPPVPLPPEAPEQLLKLLTPASDRDLDPDFLEDQPPSPFHRLGHSVIRGLDGSWSKTYTLRHGRGDSIVDVLKANVPGFPEAPLTNAPPDAPPTEVTRWVLHKDFQKDDSEAFGKRSQIAGVSVADVLVVTAPPETLLFIDELLFKLLADLPQIELEVRIVEVNLDDLVDWDSRIFASSLEDPSLPFDPVTNPIDGSFGAGVPILEDGQPSGAGAAFSSFIVPDSATGFLLSLQGVHDDLAVDAILSFLQTIGASEIISSPTITVLNGHRALLTTGTKVPVFTATGIGTTAQVTTSFEETGVVVEMIPFILSEDVIRIDLSVNVSAVTGEVAVVLADSIVSTPIISQRDAATTVHVHSGQVFSVGGLRSTESIETTTKVPFLGDIPLLGWLFKSRASRQRNTEIVFFVTPRIRTPSESLVNPLGG